MKMDAYLVIKILLKKKKKCQYKIKTNQTIRLSIIMIS